MSQDPARPPGDEPSRWEELLRSMLGPQAAEEAIRAMRASGLDPEAMSAAAGLPADRNQLMLMITQMQQLLAAGGGGPVNWDLAQSLARQTAFAGGDPAVTAAQAEQVRSALQVADLWLDAATELGPAGGGAHAWSRGEWVERTLPTWKRLSEPVAASVAQALVDTVTAQAEHMPPEIRAMAEQMGAAQGMLRQLGGAVFGMQLGQAVGTLAREAFGSTDTGLPLVEEPLAALVPANVAEFTEGLDAPADEVRHFLAVREVAHTRLFAQVPWLRAHLLGIVEAYAREITIDTDAMEEAVRGIDPTNPEQLREAISGGVFALEHSPAQQAALLRLETALAVVEGWVEEVTAQAVAPHLPHAVALREMLRRRRATDGPAEQTFAGLVGLELRPRRLREAATLWASLGADRGIAERDALWSHPDLMPTPEELDDPRAFVATRQAARAAEQDVDDALAALLAGTLPEADDDADAQEGRAAGEQNPDEADADARQERAAEEPSAGDGGDDAGPDALQDPPDEEGPTGGDDGDPAPSR
ncbi:zinc-dependent metalloprotease [Georgenia sp. TF02-10]|uniref:zinc-dependent metalloprotease n=1 Tax=Georgenia sp. TF02-10 TaxID=2917725 RepID=UPI001FA7F16A|nr:zinc-dependent metalloprotease [Georgenia sp. TF02-10]UNX53943.1 zinc-dependent metalloprotease [Georgenia sp. TF02-10]